MNNDEELSKKVHSWLETQGYATEMKVAMQLKKYNFGVLQSFYYDDPETNISREIDVIARSIDNGGLLEMFSVHRKLSCFEFLIGSLNSNVI